MKNRGDDATENRHFQERKQLLQGRKNVMSFGSRHFIFLMKNRGDDATENVNFQREKKRVCRGAKISS